MKKAILAAISVSLLSGYFMLHASQNKQDNNTSTTTFNQIEKECSSRKDVIYNIIYDREKDSEKANTISDAVYKNCVREFLGE